MAKLVRLSAWFKVLTFSSWVVAGAACSGAEFANDGAAGGAPSAGGSAGSTTSGGSTSGGGGAGSGAVSGGETSGGAAAGTNGGTPAGGSGGNGGGGTGGGTSGTGGTGGAPPVCEPKAEGVHVSALGGNDAPATGTCGSASSPCKTVARALLVAKQNGIGTITLSKGTFEEDDLLVDFAVRIQGGFTELGGEWSAKCDATRRTLTTVRPKTKAKSLSVTGGDVTLEALTVTSRTIPAAAGESMYGVFATGTATKLSLVEVNVTLAAAGDAAPVAKAADGGTAPTPGTCAAGNGANGPGGAAVSTASLVTFDPTGAVSANGTPGDDGKPGSASSVVAPVCALMCASCIADRDTDPPYNYFCTAPNNSEDYSSNCYQPLVGCGGGGGKAGAAGRTGGSVIAVYAWGATINVKASELTVGNGGNGSDGGLAGAGAPGSVDPKTTVSCSDKGLSNCTQTPGGAAPGCQDTSAKTVVANRGGKGGDGSRGGGGAGGHSYGVYVGGGGVLAQVGSKITAGAAGKGGAGATQAGTGPGGVSKPVGP